MARQPAVANAFYPGTFMDLDKQINDSFKEKLGPGDLPASRKEKTMHGIIVPHAGYTFSGECAAWAYMEIAEHTMPDTYIIIGPNHREHKSGISIEDWKTPLGLIKTDKQLAIALKEQTDLDINETIHMPEHSIEVQLPFLQSMSKDRLHELQILPILFAKNSRAKRHTQFVNRQSSIVIP